MPSEVVGLFMGLDNPFRIKRPALRRIDQRIIRIPLPVKKAGFWGVCQEYILDKTAPDTRFDQCLQGFRVENLSVLRRCQNSALSAIMRRKL